MTRATAIPRAGSASGAPQGRVRRPPVWAVHIVVLVGALLLLAGGVLAQERPGTLSLGIQGQYGFIFGPSDFAEDFDHGAGFGVRIRYALGGPQAFGISFESQTFGPTPEPGDENPPQDLRLANVTVEYLRYFNRGQGRSQYAVFGGGLFHPTEVRERGVAAVSDGLVLVAGAGLEIFVRRTTAVDLSLRFNSLLGGDAFSATVEAAAGFHFYLIK